MESVDCSEAEYSYSKLPARNASCRPEKASAGLDILECISKRTKSRDKHIHFTGNAKGDSLQPLQREADRYTELLEEFRQFEDRVAFKVNESNCYSSSNASSTLSNGDKIEHAASLPDIRVQNDSFDTANNSYPSVERLRTGSDDASTSGVAGRGGTEKVNVNDYTQAFRVLSASHAKVNTKPAVQQRHDDRGVVPSGAAQNSANVFNLAANGLQQFAATYANAANLHSTIPNAMVDAQDSLNVSFRPLSVATSGASLRINDSQRNRLERYAAEITEKIAKRTEGSAKGTPPRPSTFAANNFEMPSRLRFNDNRVDSTMNAFKPFVDGQRRSVQDFELLPQQSFYSSNKATTSSSVNEAPKHPVLCSNALNPASAWFGANDGVFKKPLPVTVSNLPLAASLFNKGVQCERIPMTSQALQTSVLAAKSDQQASASERPNDKFRLTSSLSIQNTAASKLLADSGDSDRPVGQAASAASKDAPSLHVDGANNSDGTAAEEDDVAYYESLKSRLDALRRIDGDDQDVGSSEPNVVQNKESAENRSVQRKFPERADKNTQELLMVSRYLPFIAGKSTTRSYSVNVNVQEMLASLKSQHPALHQTFLKLCETRPSLRGQSPQVLDIVALGQAFDKDVSNLLNSLRKDLLRLLDDYEILLPQAKQAAATDVAKCRELENLKALIQMKEVEFVRLQKIPSKIRSWFQDCPSSFSAFGRDRSISPTQQCKKLKESLRFQHHQRQHSDTSVLPSHVAATKGVHPYLPPAFAADCAAIEDRMPFTQPTISSLQRAVSLPGGLKQYQGKANRKSNVLNSRMLRNIARLKDSLKD